MAIITVLQLNTDKVRYRGTWAHYYIRILLYIIYMIRFDCLLCDNIIRPNYMHDKIMDIFMTCLDESHVEKYKSIDANRYDVERKRIRYTQMDIKDGFKYNGLTYNIINKLFLEKGFKCECCNCILYYMPTGVYDIRKDQWTLFKVNDNLPMTRINIKLYCLTCNLSKTNEKHLRKLGYLNL